MVKKQKTFEGVLKRSFTVPGPCTSKTPTPVRTDQNSERQYLRGEISDLPISKSFRNQTTDQSRVFNPDFQSSSNSIYNRDYDHPHNPDQNPWWQHRSRSPLPPPPSHRVVSQPSQAREFEGTDGTLASSIRLLRNLSR